MACCVCDNPVKGEDLKKITLCASCIFKIMRMGKLTRYELITKLHRDGKEEAAEMIEDDFYGGTRVTGLKLIPTTTNPLPVINKIKPILLTRKQ
jgi:hypothetical protein